MLGAGRVRQPTTIASILVAFFETLASLARASHLLVPAWLFFIFSVSHTRLHLSRFHEAPIKDQAKHTSSIGPSSVPSQNQHGTSEHLENSACLTEHRDGSLGTRDIGASFGARNRGASTRLDKTPGLLPVPQAVCLARRFAYIRPTTASTNQLRPSSPCQTRDSALRLISSFQDRRGGGGGGGRTDLPVPTVLPPTSYPCFLSSIISAHRVAGQCSMLR